MVSFAISVIDTNRENFRNIYEKGKPSEKSERKATDLSFPFMGRCGSRIGMEKSTPVMLTLLANIIQSGGCREVS
jgi:hypothetical protein